MSAIEKIQSRFRADAKGSVAIILGVTVPVVMGFGALAVDIGFAYHTKTDMQQAIDVASLAALKALREQTEKTVFATYSKTAGSAAADFSEAIIDMVNVNAPTLSKGVSVLAQDIEFGAWNFATEQLDFDPGAHPANAVRITAEMSRNRGNAVPTFFGRMFKDFLEIKVETVAVFPIPPSIHMLSDDAVGSFSVEGTGEMDAAWIQVNSNADGAAHLDINSFDIGTDAFDIAGTATGRASPIAAAGQPAIADFLQDLPDPDYAGGCLETGFVTTDTFTDLRPGVYCGGLTIRDVEEVEFLPGTYVITGGPLLIDNSMDGKHVFGDDVLIYLLGADAQLIAQGGHLTFSGKKTGAQAGVPFFSARAPNAPSSHFIGGGGGISDNIFVHGIFYAPDTDVVTTSGVFDGKCKLVCLVAETLTINDTRFNYHQGIAPKAGNPLPGLSSTLPPYPPALEAKMQPYTIEID